MTDPDDISAIFNKFAGREVPMNSRVVKVSGYTFHEIEPALKPDPVLTEMEDTARKNGLTLRVFWDGMGGTCDYRTDRVNAYIEKEADGKYRVSPNFGIG
jgi:hypothetical protein